MRSYGRRLSEQLRGAAKAWGAIVLTGPRRCGKTWCLRRTFPRASYYLLEDPDVLSRVKSDPRGWLEAVQTPAILDEIQNAPELFRYVRTKIDGAPGRKGAWFLTGSHDFELMADVSESMAGRAAIFHLTPLSFRELGKWNLARGGYPEIWTNPRQAAVWFRSYLQSYVERDVRQITAVQDLGVFRRFLAILAVRNGQMLNKTEIAAPLGVSVPTITQWLSVLETTGLILLVPPYFENFSKRIVKTPKLYWVDTGLLAFLLGFESEAALRRSTFIGAVFEAFLASEIVKNQLNEGRPKELYWFRDHQGFEVDFVVPDRDGGLLFVEAKWSRTVDASAAKNISTLLARVRGRPARGVVVHPAARGSRTAEKGALAPGVAVATVESFLAEEPSVAPRRRRAARRGPAR